MINSPSKETRYFYRCLAPLSTSDVILSYLDEHPNATASDLRYYMWVNFSNFSSYSDVDNIFQLIINAGIDTVTSYASEGIVFLVLDPYSNQNNYILTPVDIN